MVSFEFNGVVYEAKTVDELQKVLEAVGFTGNVAVELDKIQTDIVARLEAEEESRIAEEEAIFEAEIDQEEQEEIDQIDGEELESFIEENKEDSN